MKSETKIAMGIVGAVVVVVTGGWWLVYLDKRPTSTSAFNADSEFLMGSVCFIAFIAGAVSYWRSVVAAMVVRILVALWSGLGAFTAFAGSYGMVRAVTSFNGPSEINTLMDLLGLLLLATYALATLASTLPIVPAGLARRFGVYLHFGLLPLALLCIDVLAQAPEHWFRFSNMGAHLALSLGFALLSMRMYDLRLESEASE